MRLRPARLVLVGLLLGGCEVEPPAGASGGSGSAADCGCAEQVAALEAELADLADRLAAAEADLEAIAGGGETGTASPGVLDVRDWGAVGDGVADDTAALVQGFEAACGEGGPVAVRFPPGTYRLTGSVVVPCPAVIEGPGATLVAEGGDFTLLDVRASPATVRSLAFEQGGGGWAVYVEDPAGTHDVRLEELRVTCTATCSGVHVGRIVRDVWIERSLLVQEGGVSGTGISVNVSPDEGEATNIVVRGNTLRGWRSYGFDNDSTGDALQSRFEDNTVTGCAYGVRTYHFDGVLVGNYVAGNDIGWFVDGLGRSAVVAGNVVADNAVLGLVAEQFQGPIVGNEVSGNGGGDTSAWPYTLPEDGAGLVLGSLRNATVTGNAVHDNVGWGIYVDRTSVPNSDYPTNDLLAGNTIANNGADGIWIQENLGRVFQVSANVIADNGTSAVDPVASPYGGLRVTSEPVAYGRVVVAGNTFSTQRLGGGFGTDGAQAFAVASMDPDGTQVNSTPVLVLKDNVVSEVPVALYWNWGSSFALDNVLLGDLAGGDPSTTPAFEGCCGTWHVEEGNHAAP